MNSLKIAINFTTIRHNIVLLLMFTSFFINIVASWETPSSILHRHRPKREIYFRPLHIYKQQQKDRQRLWKIREIYLQQQNSDQQHLQNYSSAIINNEYYQQVVPVSPFNHPPSTQQYVQQYYEQYYNKYFQQHPHNINNVLR